MEAEDSELNEFGSDILVEENHLAVEEYEKVDQVNDFNLNEKNEQRELVQELYTPFAQKPIHETFAASKFYSAHVDPKLKFEDDLSKVKAQGAKDKRNAEKEEFDIQLEPDLKSKLNQIRDNANFQSGK